MQASTAVASRKSPEGVYGTIAEVWERWEPERAPGQSAEDAIHALAEALFGMSAANPEIPAAYTFYGQFVTHDVTFDTRLDPRSAARPRANLRTPALDLDSVYGRGPVDQPYLYELAHPDRFVVGRNDSGELDLPRNSDTSVLHPSSGGPFCLRRSALIGDPRNDENVLVSQLHLAFLRFHNARIDAGCDFATARRLTTWHYQWVLVHDFLPRVCGAALVERLLEGRRARLKPTPLLPYEFTLAAYRFGHSMIGPAYHLNYSLQHRLGDTPIRLCDDMAADWPTRDRAAADSLEGERALPADWTVQWDRFLDLESGLTQWSRRIDPVLAHPLRRLPVQTTDERQRSLAFQTLMRGYDQGLPSGQALARHLGLEPPAGLDGSDPLWLYVLKEAAAVEAGRRLGPLGATLVAEVLIGLLRADRGSILHQPGWRPELAPRSGRTGFDLADFLIHSGAPITARDWDRRRSP